MVKRWELICIAVVLAVMACLFTVMPKVKAQSDNDYVYREGFYWYNDHAYTRELRTTPGAYYQSSCGRYYQTQASSYYVYTRVPVAVKKEKVYYPQVPEYTPDWKVQALKYAAQRDDYQTYLMTLQALGVQGQQYQFQQGTYNTYGSYNTPTYQPTGQTQYGYTYQQIKEQYGTTDLNALYLQASGLTKNAQGLAGQAHSEFSSLVQVAADGQVRTAEAQARVAEVLARAHAARLVYESTNPPASTRTTTTFRGVYKPSPALREDSNTGGDIEKAKAFLVNVGIPACGQCHTKEDGKKVKGDFEIVAYVNMPVEERARRVWPLLRASTPKEKRMPKDGEPLATVGYQAFLECPVIPAN